MHSTAQPATPVDESGDLLRRLAVLAVVIGGLASIGLFLYAGRSRHPGIVLIVLFAAWVVSPFVLLALIEVIAKRWAAGVQSALNIVAVILTVVVVTIYGVLALGPPTPKMVPTFVLVPPVSWIIIALVMATAAVTTRNKPKVTS